MLTFAGADAIYIEAEHSEKDLKRIARAFKGEHADVMNLKRRCCSGSPSSTAESALLVSSVAPRTANDENGLPLLRQRLEILREH